MNLIHLITLLHKWGLIKITTKKEMIKINDTRNQYVHPKRADKNVAGDALEMFKRITKVLRNEFEMEAIPVRETS